MATATNLPASFTAGQVLTNTNMNDLRGAFRILKIVESANDTTLRSSTTTTYGVTGLEATITPQATTNKILVIYNVCYYASAATTGVAFRVQRIPSGGSAVTVVIDEDFGYGSNSGNAGNNACYVIDSPSTTNAVTYRVEFARNQGTGIAYVNAAANKTSRMVIMEVSA